MGVYFRRWRISIGVVVCVVAGVCLCIVWHVCLCSVRCELVCSWCNRHNTFCCFMCKHCASRVSAVVEGYVVTYSGITSVSEITCIE